MSVVLRIYGEDLDIDAVLGCCDLQACAVQRRGESVIPDSKRVFSQNAIFISISESDIGDFGRQVDETLSFLDQNQSAVAALVDTPEVTEPFIDFGVAHCDVAKQSTVFPARLVQAAGRLKLGLSLTIYETS